MILRRCCSVDSFCLVRHFHRSPLSKEILELGARGGAGKYEKKKGKSEFWSAGSLAMLIIPSAAFSLGCWQVARLRWKLELIEQLEAQLGEAAVDFPVHSLDSLPSLEYRRVRLRGHFLHDREFLISPRGRFDKEAKQESAGSLLSSNTLSSHGAHVVTPFKVAGSSNLVIMVNRGWVPRDQMERKTRGGAAEPHGEVTFEAIVRLTETRPQFVGENAPERGAWFYKDFDRMAEYCNARPIYVEAVYESSLPGGPIGGQTNVNIRNEHLNYLITWYTLCVATLAMWFVRFRGK